MKQHVIARHIIRVTAFAVWNDIEGNKSKPRSPVATTLSLNKAEFTRDGQNTINNVVDSNKLHKLKGFQHVNGFGECTCKRPTWKKFDAYPRQTWDFNWDYRHDNESQEPGKS